ncbi:hypothetical protein [Paractinoplanes rishiriensis]|uniref:Uncharacterized protein n=1 Tax=Paractinoplanes rishiriensis TaxID=1050105 RepID=A0A919K448_9ACTN|nr:hypothetical protein [Actinoplanes rishiriensis]GIE98957.1 hypothetical protein Ari01nite_64220 [Actinoplanes rishiriensis]
MTATVLPTRADTIQHRFERYHAEHPEVFARLERMAGEWFDLGHPAVSIGMLWEAMRWLTGTSSVEPIRLNDHYRSRYVRMLIDKHPDWEARFRVRELRTA